MNTRCIKRDLVEARDQLNEIISGIDAGKTLPEGAFLVYIQHAYRHLNLAWNARHVSAAKYQKMSMRDFNQGSKFPKGTEWKSFHQTRKSKSGSRASPLLDSES